MLTYSKIVVPTLAEKLPKSLRIIMVRSVGKTCLEWSIKDFLCALDLKLEVQEIHAPTLLVKTVGKANDAELSSRRRGPNLAWTQSGATASALYTPGSAWHDKKCVFCDGDHISQNCNQIRNSEERRDLLRKEFKCLVCLKSARANIMWLYAVTTLLASRKPASDSRVPNWTLAPLLG